MSKTTLDHAVVNSSRETWSRILFCRTFSPKTGSTFRERAFAAALALIAAPFLSGASTVEHGVVVIRGKPSANLAEREVENKVTVWRGKASSPVAPTPVVAATEVVRAKTIVVYCTDGVDRLRTQGFYSGHPLGRKPRVTQGFFSGPPQPERSCETYTVNG